MILPLFLKGNCPIFIDEIILIMTNTDSSRKIHHGRNIKRFREMFGLEQEALALELGDDWSQKKVSGWKKMKG